MKVIEEGPRGYHAVITEPPFAIDFVPAQELYAIDYNVGPRLAGTGMANILSPAQVVDMMREALTRN